MLDVRKRNRRISRRAGRGNLWTFVYAAQARARRRLVVFDRAYSALSLAEISTSRWRFSSSAGFGMLLFFSTSNTVLQTIVPDEMRGRVMGVWSLVFGAMIPLGSLEAGAVRALAGTPFALAFGAIICAVSALVTLVRDSAP